LACQITRLFDGAFCLIFVTNYPHCLFERGAVARQSKQRSGSMSAVLDALPPELGRHRILSTRDTVEFVGLSISEWRELRSRGEAPAAIKIGTQKQGWRIGDLIDWLESRAQQKTAA
jgi:predicted DNA-binding transcriptional regulator AlpA